MNNKIKTHPMDIVYKTLDLRIPKENKKNKDYDKLCALYGKMILKDFKKRNLSLKLIFEKNYILNIVLNYGLLNNLPGSLVDFSYFKINKILDNKKKILKILKK